ncbi:MAG: hypothetical protein JW797_17200 [Bradymonadales bacterium]|nr:hypothetical protein [Bradymonadales bacterium]
MTECCYPCRFRHLSLQPGQAGGEEQPPATPPADPAEPPVGDRPQGSGPAGLDRRRVGRVLLVAALMVALILVLRTWQGRAVDVTLVHRFPDSDHLLPVSVQVMVWQKETLLADALFTQPASLAELEHLVRVPPGNCLVTVTLFRGYEENLIRYEQPLAIDRAGRYILTYHPAREIVP